MHWQCLLMAMKYLVIYLVFTIYKLARSQDIQVRLYAEMSDVLAKYDGKYTFEALHEMECLDNIIYETVSLDIVDPLRRKICKIILLILIDVFVINH